MKIKKEDFFAFLVLGIIILLFCWILVETTLPEKQVILIVDYNTNELVEVIYWNKEIKTIETPQWWQENKENFKFWQVNQEWTVITPPDFPSQEELKGAD